MASSNTKPKTTITLKKAATTAKASTEPRRYSTRAKQAARRDGRTLDYQLPQAEAAVVQPSEAKRTPKPTDKRGPRLTSAPPSGSASTGEHRRRRDTTGGASGNTAGSGKAPAARPARDGRDGRDGYKARESRDRRDSQETKETRDASNDRRKSREVDAAKRAAPRPNAVPTPQREPDGLIRVSKLLSKQGLCSRREADSYIARGWVWVDGERVTELGTRVLPTAKLRLDRQAAAMQESRMTVLLHKPVGYVSGQAEDGHEPASVLVTAEHQLPSDPEKFRPEVRRGLAPAGRLDIDSTGLLVLTQDGRIAKQLIGEDSEVEKEYLVRVEGTLSDADLARLNHGLELDGEALKPAKVKRQNEDQLNFILKEGKKRQIRRMCELVGLKVVGLKRIRIGNVKLSDLPMGKWRFLRADEGF